MPRISNFASRDDLVSLWQKDRCSSSSSNSSSSSSSIALLCSCNTHPRSKPNFCKTFVSCLDFSFACNMQSTLACGCLHEGKPHRREVRCKFRALGLSPVSSTWSSGISPLKRLQVVCNDLWKPGATPQWSGKSCLIKHASISLARL